jgi:hypothetical protein
MKKPNQPNIANDRKNQLDFAVILKSHYSSTGS